MSEIKNWPADDDLRPGDLVRIARKPWWAFWRSPRVVKVKSIKERIDGVWMGRLPDAK